MAAYPLPMAPSTLTIGSNGLPVNPVVTAGENFTAVASYPAIGTTSSTTVSFNMNSGAANWSYRPSTQGSTSLPTVLSDNSVVLQDSQLGLIPISNTGNAGTVLPNVQQASPWSLGQWFGLSGGAEGMFVGAGTSLAYPWPVGTGGAFPSYSSGNMRIANIIPAVLGDQLQVTAAQALQYIESGMPASVQFNKDALLATQATAANFLAQTSPPTAPPVIAVGYIGHSFTTTSCAQSPGTVCSGPVYSIGFHVSDGNPPNPLNPNIGWQNLQATPAMGTAANPVGLACGAGIFLPPPNGTYCNPNSQLVPPNGMQTQARVVFMGACDIGPVMYNIWNISPSTTGQVLIVPVTQDTTVVLGHALGFWQNFLYQMITVKNPDGSHVNAGQAVNYVNNLLHNMKFDLDGNVITEQWQAIGDALVTFY